MKKKAIILAIAGVLATPSAFAAEDDMGMHFTSASEGLYGSIRAGFFDNVVDDYGSRIGVNGYNDLGNGLEGFYTFEFRTDKGSSVDNARSGGSKDWNIRNNKTQVGLRGDFGQFKIGRGFDAAPYELVYGGTDIANWQSGTAKGGYAGASNVYYRTPNMDGFEAGMGFQVDGIDANDEDLDNWNVAAKYSMQGLTAGLAYASSPSALATENEVGEAGTADDLTAWGISLGYGQDNWSLNGWYGEDNASDMKYVTVQNADGDDVPGTKAQDRSAYSLAGSVAVNQMNIYAVYETIDGVVDGKKDIYTTLGAQYNLGAKARVWVEYIAQDLDSDTTADDYVAIGLRHDF